MAKDDRSKEDAKRDFECGFSYLEMLLNEMEILARHGQRPDPKEVGSWLQPLYYDLCVRFNKPLKVHGFKDPESFDDIDEICPKCAHEAAEKN